MIGRKSVIGTIGRKAYGLASLGRKISSEALKYVKPIRQGVEMATPLAASFGPEGLAAGLAASSFLKRLEKGAGTAARLTGRAQQYASAAQGINAARLAQLGSQDLSKTAAAIERREAAKQFEELPQYSDDLFH